MLARVVTSRAGSSSWFDRLAPEIRDELEAVRQAYDPTRHQKRQYALAVIAEATDRGWEISGEQGVIRWLEKR